MDDTIYGWVQNLSAAATILLKLACVYTLLSVSAALKRWQRVTRPTVVLQPPTETLTTTPAARPTFPANSMMDQMVREIVTKEAEAKPAPPPPPPPREIIECGNCGKEIKAQPLTSMFVDKQNYLIYQCEHCQAQVKLPTN